MTTTRVNPDSRASIEAAIVILRAEQKRAPGCMAERYHERYNEMLDDWSRASA